MLGLNRPDPKLGIPLYRQLSAQIKAAIQSGGLRDGERLPPTRELASFLQLNRTTVTAAYELLEKEGWLHGQVGRGSFVHGVRETEDGAVDMISFASSSPSEAAFPFQDFQDTVREVMESERLGQILRLGSPQGFEPLRQHLAGHASMGTASQGDHILITSGCQQGLDLLVRQFASGGAPVAVEDPVYLGLKHLLDRSGCSLAGVPVAADGIDLVRLCSVLDERKPKLLIVTPNYQNPTGITMSEDHRRALLELTLGRDLIVVENDTYGQLDYTGRGLPTLKELDQTGQVVYLSSFSKITFPGLRVGWMIGPAAVLAPVTELKRCSDLHSDQLSQAVLHQYAASGRLADHLAGVRRTGKLLLEAALAACARHLPNTTRLRKPGGGMNLWLELPEPLDAAELLIRARSRGVSFVAGHQFAIENDWRRFLRLSFFNLEREQIERGIAILGTLVREELEIARNRHGAIEPVTLI